MHLISSGFEEWIYLFVQDSFGQKRETLPGAIVIRVEPTSSMQLTLQSCDSTNQIVVSTFRHQHTETRLKLPDSFPKESGARETKVLVLFGKEKTLSPTTFDTGTLRQLSKA